MYSSLTFLRCVYQVIPQDVVQALFAACKTGQFDKANKEVSNIISEGYPVSQMFSQVLSSVNISLLGFDDLCSISKLGFQYNSMLFTAVVRRDS